MATQPVEETSEYSCGLIRLAIPTLEKMAANLPADPTPASAKVSTSFSFADLAKMDPSKMTFASIGSLQDLLPKTIEDESPIKLSVSKELFTLNSELRDWHSDWKKNPEHEPAMRTKIDNANRLFRKICELLKVKPADILAEWMPEYEQLMNLVAKAAALRATQQTDPGVYTYDSDYWRQKAILDRQINPLKEKLMVYVRPI